MTPPSILVIDDDVIQTDMLGIVLELNFHAKITLLNESVGALDLLQREPFSLLITDYLMPELNGLQLVRQIRAKGMEIPILMLTGYHNDPELESRPTDLGTFVLMTKPWNNQELLKTIAHLLSRQETVSPAQCSDH
jgi:two-component system response regulator MprA